LTRDAPMLRYYAIATVIVLTVAVIATVHFHDFRKMRLGPSNHAPPVQHLRSGDSAGENHAALAGDAPWALSALPDCFMQQTEWSGSTTYVVSHLPRSARRIAPGAEVRYGPCTIFVRSGEVYVRRDADRFRIPPAATLYRDGSRLLLLRTTGRTAVLRSYTITMTQ
jgi:hypothetical protein